MFMFTGMLFLRFAGTALLQLQALLPGKAALPLDAAWSVVCSSRSCHVCLLRDGQELQVHPQRMACVSVSLHHLPATNAPQTKR